MARKIDQVCRRAQGAAQRAMCDPRVDKIGRRHVRNFMSSRNGVTPRTLRKDVTTLSAIFAYAIDVEYADENPAQKAKLPRIIKREPVILLPDQYERLLAACARKTVAVAASEPDQRQRREYSATHDDPMLFLYVLMLGETGMRSGSEALWVKWEHIDIEAGEIKIVSHRKGHRTKSGKSRVVPVTPRLGTALREHVLCFRNATYNGETSPWVFHHPYARRRAKAGQRIGSLRRAFEKAAERAGLPADLHQHDMRHTRVTTWLAKGASPVHVREAVGHSDLRTTMEYTHLAKEHVAALRALETGPSKASAERQA